MIQDIGPHIFDNTYRVSAPTDADFALYYVGREMLICREGDAVALPTFAQLSPAAKQDAEYLFSMDGIGCYLLRGTPELRDKGLELRPVSEMRKAETWIGFAGVTGWQLERWERAHRFCGQCGAPMRRSGRERAFVCPECKTREYPKISPAVIMAISDGDDLLMIKSPGPATNSYHLVAGYVEVGETFEQTVAREAMEEVGVKVKNIRYYKSQPWSFSDTIMVGFTAELDGPRTPFHLQEEEIADAKWVPRSEIPVSKNSASIGSEMIENFRLGKR